MRKQINLTGCTKAAQAVADVLLKQDFFLQSQHVACYLPFQNEIDTAFIIEMIWREKKNCYLPIVKNAEEKALNFVRYKQNDELALNQYSILEPAKKAPRMAPEKLDLVIVPLIAFDAHGHRLGTGGGFYDSTFEFMHMDISKKPLLIGLGYAAQQADMLPADPWDVVLNGVITEKGFTGFSPSS